jgi:peptidoglycan/xylan/chitin deacetylase (PgdA/CDA1 family)
MSPRPKQRLKRPLASLLELRARWSGRRAGLALCYHRVGDPEGDAERELVPALGTARFAEHVAYLGRRFRLVRASELLAAAAARRRGERFPVAITFDDDLPSHVRAAKPVLERHGATATFFLCGASLDDPFSFWFEDLQLASDRGELDRWIGEELVAAGAPADRPHLHRVAVAIEGLAPARRRELAGRLRARAGPPPPDSGIRAGDVSALAAAGFEIGFHTLRHDSLLTLDDDGLARTMSEGREAVARAAGRAITAISYPHGKADGRGAAAAREAGYECGFTGTPGAVGPGTDPLLVGRLDPGLAPVEDLALAVARLLSSGG